jgi:hypothetical protein
MEEKKLSKYNLNKFFHSYYSENSRLQDIFGLKEAIVTIILDSGFVFDYHQNIFVSTYDFKLSENITINFLLCLGKSSEGYYLTLSHEESGISQYFSTQPDFNNYINPINLLFQLKTFVETDIKMPLFFSILEDVDNCTKNEDGYVELLCENKSNNIHNSIPVLINDKSIIYRRFTNDKKYLLGRENDYGYYNDYHSVKNFTESNTIKTSDGKFSIWEGQRYLTQLRVEELDIISKKLKETLEVKNKKTFKKFVQEENKLENNDR